MCLSDCFLNSGGSSLQHSDSPHHRHRVRFGKMLLHHRCDDDASAFCSFVTVCDVLVLVLHIASHCLTLTSLRNLPYRVSDNVDRSI